MGAYSTQDITRQDAIDRIMAYIETATDEELADLVPDGRFRVYKDDQEMQQAQEQERRWIEEQMRKP